MSRTLSLAAFFGAICALLLALAAPHAAAVAPLPEKESISETVHVVLEGKLNLKAGLGYPVRGTHPIVVAQGRIYVLQGLEGLRLARVEHEDYLIPSGDQPLLRAADKLDGKTVTVEGTFAGFHRVTTMCIPDSFLPILRVSSIRAGKGESVRQTVTVRLRGALEMTTVRSGGREHEDEPVFRMMVKGKTYGLEVPAEMRERAEKLWGKAVVATGTLELRRTFSGDVWQVVVVRELNEAGAK
jgi:hypothetical protein